MRVLATGIDTLNLSARGVVREATLAMLSEAQERARLNEATEMLTFPITEQTFECRSYGRRGYTYWLSSPDFELVVSGSTKSRLPVVLIDMHAAFLHSMGIEECIDQAERLLRNEVFVGDYKLRVSRIDVHADLQGFELRTRDLERFVGYGRHRRAFEKEVFEVGTTSTGFRFGKDQLVARIYDKSVEAAEHRVTWVFSLWPDDYDQDQPVVRVEFQYRNGVLHDFGMRTVDEVVSSVQDLWRYGTCEWLSLRVPTRDPRRRRWPLDPVWQEVREVRIAPSVTGLVRRRIQEATELKLLQGIQGYATSLAAVRGRKSRGEALQDIGTLIDGYLSTRGLVFEGEVARKQSRRLDVSSWVEER